ncbi:MAG: DUF1850 domain-containing protein [Treponema sp.]|nr:DUF1850 domain-containing protein [Treponema sp.]
MKRKITYAIIIIFLIVISYVIFFPRINVLSISNRKNPAQRVYSTQAYNEGFCISYTHSVNKGRVHDYYKFHKATGGLLLTSSHFVSYGAGMPELEETEGADFEVLENGYIMNNINRLVPKLVMAVGVIANHTFSPEYYSEKIIGEPAVEIPFTRYFAPQTSLIFEYKKVNFIELQRHGIKGY